MIKRICDIHGYEDVKEYYVVYRFGAIYNEKRKQRVTPFIKKSKNNGYPYVKLATNTGVPKNIRIHVLMAKSFIENAENLPCVGHRDEDKTNYKLYNLYWTTQKDNVKYSVATKKRISGQINIYGNIYLSTKTLETAKTKQVNYFNQIDFYSMEFINYLSLNSLRDVRNKSKKIQANQA